MTPRKFVRSQIIGISGGSGSGKTTLARQLMLALGADLCGTISQDSYYFDQSRQFDFDGGQVNFDHPQSIDFELMAEHLRYLRGGDAIDVPIYDFTTHKRLEFTSKFLPKPIVILDGILILSQQVIRTELDLSIFINTNEELRFRRRLRRDVAERGRTEDGIHKQFFSQVKPMHDKFVEPSRDVANIVVSGETDFAPIMGALVNQIKSLQHDEGE